MLGDGGFGIDHSRLSSFAEEIHKVSELDIQTAIVIGGGNIIRGVSAATEGMNRVTADYMGMLGVCINALALQDALERRGCDTRVMSAINMNQVAEPYIRRRSIRHMEKGRVVIFAAGTGNPFFSTDTAAALRAAEIQAEVIIKATKVNGVYDLDPMKHDNAKKYDVLPYKKVMHLGIMDSAAVSLCMENKIPILVTKMESNSLYNAVNGLHNGTVISG
jgi:uridylate kinase